MQWADAAIYQHKHYVHLQAFAGKQTGDMLQYNCFSMVAFVLVGEERQVKLICRIHTAERYVGIQYKCYAGGCHQA